jgi:Lon protease-like protein
MSIKLEKTITVRFAQDDHNQMAMEAERLGTTVADVVRKSCLFYQNHRRLEQQLVEMEKRQNEILTEVLSVMLGLTEKQKDEALEKLLANGVNI